MRGIKLILVVFMFILVGCSTSDFMADIIKKKGDKKDSGGGGSGVTVIVVVGSEEKVSIMDNGQIKREPATPDETSETKKDEPEKKK